MAASGDSSTPADAPPLVEASAKDNVDPTTADFDWDEFERELLTFDMDELLDLLSQSIPAACTANTTKSTSKVDYKDNLEGSDIASASRPTEVITVVDDVDANKKEEEKKKAGRPPGSSGGKKKGTTSTKTGRNRQMHLHWTQDEHRQYLRGLEHCGRGNATAIARDFVPTKTATQVTSHEQKYFLRGNKDEQQKKRKSIHDIRI